MLNNFYDRMIKTGKTVATAHSTISRLNRVSRYRNIEREYLLDRCQSLLKDLTYTTDDARNGVLPKISIEIDGDYVDGLAILKSAVTVYVEFLDDWVNTTRTS